MAQFIVPTIFTAVDRFSGPVGRMQRAMMGLTTVGGAGGAAMTRSLEKTSAAAMDVASSTAMMAAAVLIPLGLATKAASDFEKEMTNVATLVDTTKESMSDMSDEVLKIAAKMPVKISDLTESLYQIRSAGVAAADAMHVLETSAKLSVAGLSSATEATKAVTSAMNSFKQQGLSVDQIANSFFLTVKQGKTKMDGLNESFGNNAPIVAAAGIKLQEFNAATAAMTNAGMQASEAQNSLKMSVIALKNPSSNMIDVFKKLGVASGQDLIDKMGGLVDALDLVKTTATSMHLDLNEVFKRTAATAVTLLTGNLKDKFKDYYKEQLAGADVLTTAFQKQLGTTAAQAQIAKNNLVTLGIRIGELLLPALTSLLKTVTPIVHGLGEFAHKHKILSGLVVRSVAIFGAFAAAAAVVSFTIGTATRAIWLISGVMKAYNFAAGVASVVTGQLALNGGMLNKAMAEAPGFAAGATAAMGGLAGMLTLVLTRTNVLLAGFALLIAYGDKISDWANDSAMGKFFNAHTGNKDAVDESLVRLYKKDPEAAKKYVAEHPGNATSGIEDQFKQADRDNALENIYKQQQSDYEDDMLRNNGKQTLAAPDVHLTVNVDKSGSVSVVKGNGAPVPRTNESGRR